MDKIIRNLPLFPFSGNDIILRNLKIDGITVEKKFETPAFGDNMRRGKDMKDYIQYVCRCVLWVEFKSDTLRICICSISE